MRALYVSHTGMTEPLGQSQVVPYVEGLARAGVRLDIVCFEPAGATKEDIARVEARLGAAGVGYSWGRRSLSHKLWVKAAEGTHALLRLLARSLGSRPRVIHARSYLPAAAAHLAASIVPQARLLFDVRGLLGEEFVDAGHWRADSLEYRITKRAEKRLFARAHGVVVLTARHRAWLQQEQRLVREDVPLEVIPCCVDTGRFTAHAADRAAARQALGAGDRFVLTYAGSLGSWYREPEMARFFAAVLRHRDALFAVFTQSPPDRMQAALDAAGVPAAAVRFVKVPSREMPRHLAAADAAVSFIAPCFSKLGSSPTKVAEFLAMGLPVVMNRGIGDSDELIDREPAVIDAGALGAEALEAAAARLMALDPQAISPSARQAAIDRYCLDRVGIPRYRRIYEALA